MISFNNHVKSPNVERKNKVYYLLQTSQHLVRPPFFFLFSFQKKEKETIVHLGCLFVQYSDSLTVDVLDSPLEHSGVQCKTSAVVESFNQVQKSPQIPEGESVPDFEVKLRPITAQEGEVNHSFHSTAA